MKSGSFISGNDAIKHQDFKICKTFLNLWIDDSYFDFDRTHYYFENYERFSLTMGHLVAPPSHCFFFPLRQQKHDFLIETRDYCYHGTAPNLIKKIVNEGLRSPNRFDVKQRFGTYKREAIYTTKIPQHCQIFADACSWSGKYFQMFLLVRQDISKVTWHGPADSASPYAKDIYDGKTQTMQSAYHLHGNLMDYRELQWGTDDKESLFIEGIFVKMHREHPKGGEFIQISQLISRIQARS